MYKQCTSLLTPCLSLFLSILSFFAANVNGIVFFFKNYLFILLYNIVLVLPYIDMNPTWVYMCSQFWNLPPHTSLPSPFLWVIPVHQPLASCIMHQTWTGDSFPIWKFTCFNVILPFQPTTRPCPLPQSPKDCSVHLCLFFCFAYKVIVTTFLNSIYMH